MKNKFKINNKNYGCFLLTDCFVILETKNYLSVYNYENEYLYKLKLETVNLKSSEVKIIGNDYL